MKLLTIFLLALFFASGLYIGLHVAAARFPGLEPVTVHYADPKTGETWETIEYVPRDERR